MSFLKLELYAQLNVQASSKTVTESPVTLHRQVTMSLCEQVVGEVYVDGHTMSGRSKRHWLRKPGVRVEALDCAYYAIRIRLGQMGQKPHRQSPRRDRGRPRNWFLAVDKGAPRARRPG